MASLDFEPLRYEEMDPERRPSGVEALVPLVAVAVFLGVGSGLLKLAPHAPLLWSVAFTGLFARFVLGRDWADLYDGIADSLLMGLQAVLILFAVYALIATWIDAGTVPTLMSYGLAVLSPAVFLPVAALLAAVVAFAIGSSWTTAGTLGVAFIGIGAGLGLPEPMTAGAVLSGAYAGDKQSPLSDTTNLAAAVTDTDLYDHIRAMRPGTLLAFGLAVGLYAWLGLRAGGAVPAGRVGAIRGAIAGSYAVTPLAFLPLAVTFGLALAGVPALPTLTAGVFAGVGTAVLVQGRSFVAAWETFLNGTAPETGLELVNGLLASGGLSGSAWTVSVVVLALSLGGLLESTGILAVLAHRLAEAVWGPGSLVGTTGVSAFLVNAFSAQQYMSIVVPGMTLRGTYDDYGMENRELSRAIEAAGTPTGALLPWHAGAVYMSGVFGVPTLAYAPFYFFGLLSPAVLFAMALTGVGIAAGKPDGTGDGTAGDGDVAPGTGADDD